MLQRLTLKNFKLFDETGVTIEPGKVTVLIGVNGAGKSSVLQALLLLKQSLDSNMLMLTGPLIKLGDYRDIAHGQNVESPVDIGLVVSYKAPGLQDFTQPYISPSGAFSYHVVANQNVIEQTAIVTGGDGNKELEASHSSHGGAVTPENIFINNEVTLSLIAAPNIGCPFSLAPLTQGMSVQGQMIFRRVSAFLSTICTALDQFYFVPAIRGFDALAYDVQATRQAEDLSAVGGSEEQAALVANTIAANPDLVDDVTRRLNTILRDKGRLRFRTQQGRLISEVKTERVSVNLVNEAFGLNQLVAPLLWLSKVPRDAIVGIEEPEIHLHPRAQAALCDVFVEVATREDKQLILTTHSEHILMGLLTAVADGRLKPDDLAVYEFQREGDTARVGRLEVNEYGQIAGGLKGFLETDLDEIGELIEARFR